MSGRHLTSEQILERMAGGADAGAAGHLAECAHCHAEYARIGRALANFRFSANAWAVSPREERSWFGLRQPALATVAMLALMVLCLVLVLPARTHHFSNTAADEALLQKVNAELTRTAPRPMEPLSQLIPTDLERQ